MKKTLMALAASTLALAAHAQADFPNRALTMVVTFAPGGATDTTARVVAKKLSENLGQPVIVENRPGVGGTMATKQVAFGKADGYTILLGSVGPLAVAPHLSQNLGYDPFKDLAPLTMAVTFPNVLVVHAGVPARDLAEFIALAKRKPGDVSYASSGVGSGSNLAGELLNQRAGVSILHVPYKGGGPAMADLLGGRISAYYSTQNTAEAHVATGKLRALASTGLTRSPFMPNVPTIAESGFPGFEALNWYAFVVAGKTPLPLQERLAAELVKVLRSPDVKERLAKHYLEPNPGTREDLARYMRTEYDTWGRVIKQAGIKYID